MIKIHQIEKYSGLIAKLLTTGAYIKATKYLAPDYIIRGTRTRVGKKFYGKDIEITLTIGRPNYIERDFIKLCKMAGEPFPVKNMQFKEYNPKKNKLKGKRKAS